MNRPERFPTPSHAPPDGVSERLEVREERLVTDKHVRDAGTIEISTRTERVPDFVETDVAHEEVEIERIPAGQVASKREPSRQEGDALVIPIYEERLTVVKELVLKEWVRIRRVTRAERTRFEDVVERDSLMVRDPQNTGLVHEHPPAERLKPS